jgi:hypothetical protein
MTRSSLTLVVALLASACAPHRSTSPSSRSVSSGSAPTVEKKDRPDSAPVCFQEAPTGSHIMKTVCYTQEDLAEMRREAQDLIRQSTQAPPKSSAPNSPGASGGGR